jgi:UDP-GlcNAc:undecaprenyl-phosphate/decaprenyl-phosphate GlcNAc-1-phosphate transferase
MKEQVHQDIYPIIYAVFFVIAILFSALINSLILKFSTNLGMRNATNTGQIRWGSSSKPSLGGFSFYIVFLISIAMLGVFPSADDSVFNKQLIGLLAASSLGFLLGLADDAYNTNPLVKFIGQFTCANLLITTGYTIHMSPIVELNYFITVLWVIGLMNSINMLDNMDGITASTSASILLGGVVLIVADKGIDTFYLIIILGVLGALIGFLLFNWHPSKMYMGDTGSQFLGVFLAGISILFFWDYRQDKVSIIDFRQFLFPMLLFIVPLVDTATVFIRRLARKQSPFVGGKDHTTHHLAYLGLSDRQVATSLLCLSLVSVGLVYYLHSLFDKWENIYTILGFVYFLVVFVVMQILYNLGNKKAQTKKLLVSNTEDVSES